LRTIVLRSIALIGAAILWALSLPGLDMRQMNDLGLVSVLPPVYFAALALLSASFALAVNSRKTPGWLLFLHVVLLILIIHGTPALTYETLRYGWAWNHVGVTDYILKFGRVDPNITYESGLKIYHNWPGFFALGALFTAAPMLDLVYALANLAFMLDEAWDPRRMQAAYRRLMDVKTPGGAVFHRELSRYAREVGVQPGQIPPLRLLTWVLHSSIECRIETEEGLKEALPRPYASLCRSLWSTELQIQLGSKE